VVPGVILVETMAQSGGAGLRKLGVLGDDALFFFATVDKVKFRRQVRPGDELRSEVTNLRVSPRMIKQSGKAYVGDEIAAEAEWMCLVGEKA
jgi:3-hydroxyacyl-[acyl-carrier-protein] dehydratase